MRTARQRLLYTDIGKFYKPNALVKDTDNGGVKDLDYSLAYANVRGKYITTPEVTQPEVIGRTKQDNIFTLDRFHTYADQEVEDGWYFFLETPHFPESQSWFAVMGNPQTKGVFGGRKANYRLIYLKRVVKPRLRDG